MRIVLNLGVIAACLLAVALAAVRAQPLQYPVTKKVAHTDIYFGTVVSDPYRWLEDDTSTAVAQWVAEENAVTFGYLAKIPYRENVKDRLESIYNYSRISAPIKRGEYYLFYKNDGLQNQSVLYIQKGLAGTPEVLIDPNEFSHDGTTRLAMIAVSHDDKYLAYSLSESGSDWEKIYVLTLATKQRLPDSLLWVKISGIAWRGDGFYYSRYDAPSSSARRYTATNENHKVYYHRLRTAQAEDRLVFEDASNPLRFNQAETTEDERYLLLTVDDRGKGKDGNALFCMDLDRGWQQFRPVVTTFDYHFWVIDNIGDRLLVMTNSGAPNNRLVSIEPEHPDEWTEILPEKPEPLTSVSCVGGKLIAVYRKDVTSRVYVYDLQGTLEREIPMPSLGTVYGFGGRKEDTTVFYTFTSFTTPQTAYRYDIPSRTSSLYNAPEVKFRPGDFVTEQVFYRSKDGTKVPMFIVHGTSTTLNGDNPTLLSGYGGFNISMMPTFDPLLIGWLEQGGIYALPNLRGGGEYGEAWHEGGMRLHKQNVFDDFIAAAEWLIGHRYTNPRKLAIAGGSNGGLLVGAVMNKRPELFRAALPAVGVMDMLRFQKFTIGWNWIPDYGSSDDSVGFRYLYAYSPLHNIRDNTSYPATLVTTADHDDRVVPAHSFKYIATLQEKNRGPNPILIRIETKSGHSSSSTSKRIEVRADEYTFLFHTLGLTPAY